MTTPGRDKEMSTSNVDPGVSARYRNLATDSVPVALDRAVLRAARDEITKESGTGWRSGWFKPAAFVVMVALSFAVILEMNDANVVPIPLLNDGNQFSAESPSDVFKEAADKAAGQIRDAEEAVNSAIQNSGKESQASADAGQDTDQIDLISADAACDERQRSTMTTWWRCIEALESRGASAAAERELRALMRAFPGFVKPD